MRAMNPQLAAQTLERSLMAMEPSSGLLAAAHNDLGVSFGQLGLFDRAAREFELALNERTRLGELLTNAVSENRANLGIALHRAGKTRAAIPQLEAALSGFRQDPASATHQITDTLEHLSLAYAQLGDCAQARERLADVLSRDVAGGRRGERSRRLAEAVAGACVARR
jgi:tetratricopeptide (TPR) repeat protein